MYVSRAGQYVRQAGGYRAFIPAPLPPNPDLFVAMYVRHEAVLSSQIEGTQSTLEDVLEFEVDAHGREHPKDVVEGVNYVRAMNDGLDRLKHLPLSLRLIREIHERLLAGVRGSQRTPGEFRRSQNWIGSSGCTLSETRFVPPPVHEMHQALDNLEKFLHEREAFPALVHCGLAHAQFETIHPFLDGNGRVGRLLITFLLCWQEILHRPLLYLSHYLKAHRTEYYDSLQAIRNDGDWEHWLKFFLRGVFQVAEQATETVRAILSLRESHRHLIQAKSAGTGGAIVLLEYLFEHPVTTVRLVEKRLQCSYGSANKLVRQFVAWRLLEEMTGYVRNRRFRYRPYVELFERSAPG